MVVQYWNRSRIKHFRARMKILKDKKCHLLRTKFSGITGLIMTDLNGDRIPQYYITARSPDGQDLKPYSVATFDSLKDNFVMTFIHFIWNEKQVTLNPVRILEIWWTENCILGNSRQQSSVWYSSVWIPKWILSTEFQYSFVKQT